jgi:hypothetical protein
MDTIEITRSEYERLKREAELRMEDANEMVRLRRRLVQAENCMWSMMSLSSLALENEYKHYIKLQEK